VRTHTARPGSSPPSTPLRGHLQITKVARPVEFLPINDDQLYATHVPLRPQGHPGHKGTQSEDAVQNDLASNEARNAEVQGVHL